MSEPTPHSNPSTVRKFLVAVSGTIYAIKSQNSFRVHLPVALVVIGMGSWLQLEPWRWVALVFAITIVITTEMLNTSIEDLVAVLHPEHDPKIGRVLDVAAGAVLITSIAAITIGLIVFLGPLWQAVVGG